VSDVLGDVVDRLVGPLDGGLEVGPKGRHPSLVWLARKLVARGEILRARDLVIPGAPVKLVDVPRGSVVRSCFTSCGEVQADFLWQPPTSLAPQGGAPRGRGRDRPAVVEGSASPRTCQTEANP
jgi:hypothetical protein